MRTRNYLLSATTAALLIAAPAIAGAEPMPASASPISIQHVNVHNGEYESVSLMRPSAGNSIFVKFTNESPNVATKVVFDVLSDGQYAGQITDAGTFSQGVAIASHYDNTFDDSQPLTDVTVVPVEVDYANGQTWTAPATN